MVIGSAFCESMPPVFVESIKERKASISLRKGHWREKWAPLQVRQVTACLGFEAFDLEFTSSSALPPTSTYFGEEKPPLDSPNAKNPKTMPIQDLAQLR